MDASLKIVVGADINDVDKKLSELSKQINFTKKQITDFEKGIGNIDVKTYDKLKASLESLEKEAKRLSNVKIGFQLDKNASVLKIGDQFVVTTKNVQQFEAQLLRFQTTLATTTDPKRIDLLNRAIEGTKQRITALNAVNLGRINGSIENLKKGSNNATIALGNLSRVAQDAPFGFIAIANNIDPLFESFGRLKNETGSTGAAFKSLGQSLIGPAGIAVGISAVTALVTVAIQKYGSLGNALSALFGGISKLELAQRELNLAIEESAASAQGEVSSLNALLSIAKDKALSDQARQQALDKINKEYDKYLPKLTLENVESQATADAVDKLTAALFRQAKIRGAESFIEKQSEAIAKLRVEEAQLLADRNKKGLISFKGSLLGQAFNELNIGLNQDDIKQTEVNIQLAEKALRSLLTEDAKAGTLNIADKKNLSAVDQLNAKLKAAKNNLAKATNPTEVKKYTDEIITLKKELAGLNPSISTPKETGSIVNQQEAAKKILKIQQESNIDILKEQQKLAKDEATITQLRFQERFKVLENEYQNERENEKKLIYQNQKDKENVLSALDKQYASRRSQIQLEADLALFNEFEKNARKSGEKAVDAWVDAWNKGLSPVRPPDIIQDIDAPRVGNLQAPDFYAQIAKLELDLQRRGIKLPKIEIGTKLNQDYIKQLESLDALNIKAQNVATTISETLTPAFNAFFQALVTGSGSPFKAFGQAIKQLLAQIAAAIVKAIIFRAILSALPGGQAFSLGGSVLQGLGSVLGGTIGGTSAGSISTGGITGSANTGQQRLVTEIRGNSLALILQRTSNTTNRLG